MSVEALMQEAHNRQLRRHGGLKQVMYLGPMSITPPTSLFTSGTTLIDPIDLGFFPVGLVTDEGQNFTDTFETEGTSSVGYTDNTREDVTTTENTVAITLQESYNKFVESVVRGADYSDLTMSANGEVVFDAPATPVFEEYRGLVIAADGPPDDEWIMGKFYYALKLSARDAYSWAKGSTIDRPITLKAFPDPETGQPYRDFVAGTGPLKHAEAMGFTAP